MPVTPLEIDRISSFIKDYCQSTGFKNLVIGLSGGIDSALSAALAVQAMGADHVFAINIPYRNSHPDSAADACLVAKHLGISLSSVDLSPMTDSYFDAFASDASALRRGNWMARIRMNVLYDFAAAHEALVVGTGNRTELLVGYCTQYGDSACAFEPIGHLYKTEVWEMAGLIGLPAKVIEKTPTADLWEGQSDESELGISYPELDRILIAISQNDAASLASFAADSLARVKKLMKNSEFKRVMPPLLERN